MKPQVWREAAAAYGPLLSEDAVVVSVAVGVRLDDIEAAFGGRRTARVMPTTGVGVAKGVATVFARDAGARSRAHALFDPVSATVDITDEGLMDAAAATSASGPAYVYAFVEALAAAGVTAGLPREAAEELARATVISAAALLEESGESPEALRMQVASPGGTTEAALRVLAREDGLETLLRDAVAAAARRAEELAR